MRYGGFVSKKFEKIKSACKELGYKGRGGYDVIFSVLKMTFPVDCGQSLRRAKV